NILSAPLDAEFYDDFGRLSIKRVAAYVGEPVERFAKMVGMTGSGLRKNPVSQMVQAPGRRFVWILGRLERELGSKKVALMWLRTPDPALEEKSALELLAQGEFAPVEWLLHAMTTGTPI
ncbi:MAG TPA: hypothetical protein VMS32_07805, partial [Verrucomicrobiae bacterium]|nr:hypothetical protein [Verrucomicrobiae bacterium]